MTAVFHTWPYGRLIEIQSNLRRKKLHRSNQGSNFLRGSFSNRDNVRAPIQFRRESQPQHLKRCCILKNRPIHFHINSTSVFRPVKRNQLSFSRIKNNSLLLSVSHFNNVFCVLFLTFELLFFNGTRNMNYGRKFHFAGIFLHSKYEKSSRFSRVF